MFIHGKCEAANKPMWLETAQRALNLSQKNPQFSREKKVLSDSIDLSILKTLLFYK